MKLYHFGLLFVIVAMGFFVTAQVYSIAKIQQAEIAQTDYDVLVAAVNAAVDVAFSGGKSRVTKERLALTEEVFFQTMTILQEGETDRASRQAKKEKIPCLVVFEERGYYRYCYIPGEGYQWSELITYRDGKIPAEFFTETEALLQQYHSINFHTAKKYRMEQAGKGVWEQSLIQPCVFAIYALTNHALTEADGRFLYAASGRTQSAYFVTEDNYCHVPYCEKCKTGNIVAWYSTQKESAEDGAFPCELCMK